MRLPARHTKAFTLLELIVVIVILAVLAAIAIPTFNRVIKTSKLEVAEITLAAVARDTQALAALEGADNLTYTAFEDAASELTVEAGAAGVYAGRVEYRTSRGIWSFSPDARTINALINPVETMTTATYLPGVGCAWARASASGAVETWSELDVPAEECSGAAGDRSRTYGRPKTPIGLRVSWTGGHWLVECDAGQSVDVYVNGTWYSAGSCPLTIPGVEDDTVTAVERPADATPGMPGGWPGGAGETATDAGGGSGTGGSGTDGSGTGGSGGSTWSGGSGTAVVVPDGTGSVNVTWEPRAGLVDVVHDGGVVQVDGTTGRYVGTVTGTVSVYPVVDGVRSATPLPIVVTPTPEPAAPAVNDGTSGAPSATQWVNGYMTISWLPVENAPESPLTGYRLYRQQGSGTWNGALAYEGTGRNLSDGYVTVYDAAPSSNHVNDLAAVNPTDDSGTWCYRVSSYGPGGESALSPAVCADTTETFTLGNVSFESEENPGAYSPSGISTSTALAYHGTRSGVVGCGTHNCTQTGTMSFDTAGGPFSFAYRLDSELCCDKLTVALDGNTLISRGGTGSWQTYTVPDLPAGSHTLTLTFTTDGSVISGSSAAYVDEIGPIVGRVPTAPSNVRLAGAGESHMDVTFDPGVNRSLSTTGQTFTVTMQPGSKVLTGTGTQYRFTGLSHDTSYTFSVVASNDVGTSPVTSGTISMVPPAGAQRISFESGESSGVYSLSGISTSSAFAYGGSHSLAIGCGTHNCTRTGTMSFATAGGPFSFAYRLDSELCCDKLTVALDGNTLISRGGTGSWQTYTVSNLAAGEHTLTLTFTTDGSVISGSSSAYVDVVGPLTSRVPTAPTDVRVVGTGSDYADVAFNPGTNRSFDTSPQTFTMTVSPGGHTFTGTATQYRVTGLSPDTNYTVSVVGRNDVGNSATGSGSFSMVPQTAPDRLSFEVGETLTHTLGGNASISSAFAYGGSRSVRVGCSSNNCTSSGTIGFTTDGGPFSFAYRLDSELCCDKLTVAVDGNTLISRGGTGSWQTYTMPDLPAGSHTLTLTFTTDGSIISGSSSGYVDVVGPVRVP